MWLNILVSSNAHDINYRHYTTTVATMNLIWKQKMKQFLCHKGVFQEKIVQFHKVWKLNTQIPNVFPDPDGLRSLYSRLFKLLITVKRLKYWIKRLPANVHHLITNFVSYMTSDNLNCDNFAVKVRHPMCCIYHATGINKLSTDNTFHFRR